MARLILANCEGLSFFNPQNSVTHLHGLAAYVKEELPSAWELSLVNSLDSYLYF